MSYARITPDYYRMGMPDSPYHAGSPGWKDAPVPGWGQNPGVMGPRRLAVNGLGGCGCKGASGLGNDGLGLGTDAPAQGMSPAVFVLGIGVVAIGSIWAISLITDGLTED